MVCVEDGVRRAREKERAVIVWALLVRSGVEDMVRVLLVLEVKFVTLAGLSSSWSWIAAEG